MSTCDEDVAGATMPLFLELAAIGFSTLVYAALISVVFRLRVPVGLPILSSVPRGLETLVGMRNCLRFLPDAAEAVGGGESARSASSIRASAREKSR